MSDYFLRVAVLFHTSLTSEIGAPPRQANEHVSSKIFSVLDAMRTLGDVLATAFACEFAPYNDKYLTFQDILCRVPHSVTVFHEELKVTYIFPPDSQ